MVKDIFPMAVPDLSAVARALWKRGGCTLSGHENININEVKK